MFDSFPNDISTIIHVDLMRGFYPITMWTCHQQWESVGPFTSSDKIWQDWSYLRWVCFVGTITCYNMVTIRYHSKAMDLGYCSTTDLRHLRFRLRCQLPRSMARGRGMVNWKSSSHGIQKNKEKIRENHLVSGLQGSRCPINKDKRITHIHTQSHTYTPLKISDSQCVQESLRTSRVLLVSFTYFSARVLRHIFSRFFGVLQSNSLGSYSHSFKVWSVAIDGILEGFDHRLVCQRWSSLRDTASNSHVFSPSAISFHSEPSIMYWSVCCKSLSSDELACPEVSFWDSGSLNWNRLTEA